jgi:hypothetical protein
MSKKIITVLLVLVALFEILFLPKIVSRLTASRDKIEITTQPTTEDPYANYKELDVKNYPKKANFPKNYMLVFYHELEDYETIIIEDGNEYLVLDTSYTGDSGLYVKRVAGSYFYRKYYAATKKWTGWSPVDKDSKRDYMETTLTKDRWPFPKQFINDVTYTFEPSEKTLFIAGQEKIAKRKCTHYVTRSAWYEYEYWVDNITKITLQYKKTNIRFDENTVVDSFTTKKFSLKPKFDEYISDDDRYYEELD